MGLQKHAKIPLGHHVLRVSSTEQTKETAGLVVLFTCEATEEDPSYVGKTFARVFKIGGETKGQKDARSSAWTRFCVRAHGHETIDDFGGDDVVLDKLDECCESNPMEGLLVDCVCYDTGKVSGPSKDGKYKGGDPIHEQNWFVSDDGEAEEDAAE